MKVSQQASPQGTFLTITDAADPELTAAEVEASAASELRKLFDCLRLTPAQRRIADYLIENFAEAAFLSITDLADRVHVSQPAVTRFAAAAGFSGYPALREKLQAVALSTLNDSTGGADEVLGADRQASPRGTFIDVADAVRGQIEADPEMKELPPAADLMRDHEVSRGVVLRAFKVLQKEGAAEPVPGGRWRVVRPGERVDRRPLDERIADIIIKDGLEVGSIFPSASALCGRFGVSRPTVTKALGKLAATGLLSEGGQGKLRFVRALPNREGRS
ncbi:GntR family transcriptional regulator [Streptomyces umbrinus]|uniref:GntR family transcriptional regulator n=1 Tax=Streptomyces umbrinus TaxID=67370 RepID=UPI003C30E083